MYVVAGLYKNRRLIVPKGHVVRPTSSRLRESLFNICQHIIEDAVFLDLFAGSGAMGIEALSRGARQSIFVDQHKDSIHCIRQNIANLHLETKTKVLQGDVFTVLERLDKKNEQFDLIYADPPYDSWFLHEGRKISFSMFTLQVIDQGNLLAPNGNLFIEDAFHSELEEFPLETLQIKSVRRAGRSVLLQYEKKEGYER